MTTYDNATITLGGKPIARVTVTAGQRRENLIFGDANIAPKIGGKPPPWTFGFTMMCEGAHALAAFASLPPVETPAIKATVPWGILGKIEILGWIDGSRITQGPQGTTATLGMIADEKSLRRAIANAVRRVIVDRASRESALLAVRKKDGESVFSMTNQIIGRWNDSRPRYRGERKKRKAMRRLLRAAGATVERRETGR